MTRSIALLVVLAGCASEAPAPFSSEALSPAWSEPSSSAQPEASSPIQAAELAPALDARAWVNDLEGALADTSQHSSWNLIQGPLWTTAAVHLDLDRACDTYFDGDSLVYDPLPPDSDFNVARRGLLNMQRLDSDESVVTVQCTYAAYQGSYLLVHVEGDDASLLSPLVAPGRMHLRVPLLSTPGEIAEDRRVSTFAKARGLSDCGTYTTYQIGEGTDLQTIEVRERACGDDIPDEIAPDTWPIVFPADG